MIKYSPEKKAEALKMIDEMGVSKTNEATGISAATLFKWKREAAAQAPSRPKKKAAVSKGTSKKATAAKKDTSKKAAMEAAKELLKDDGTAEKIQQLEAENAHLRDTNTKLRKALAALLD